MTRVQNSIYFDNVVLDWDRMKVGFRNDSISVEAGITADGSDGNQETGRIAVNGAKFFTLCNSYDTLDVSDNVFKAPDGSTFLVPKLSEPLEIPFGDGDGWDESVLGFDDNFGKLLNLSTDYIDKDPRGEFSALFFRDGNMVALSRRHAFFADIKGYTKKSFSLPALGIRVITSLGFSGDVSLRLKTKNGIDIVDLVEGMTHVQVSGSANTTLSVDPFGERFRQNYEHDTYFTVSTDALSGTLGFLQDYLSDVGDAVCQIRFVTKDNAGAKLDEPYMVVENAQSGEVSCKCPLRMVSDADYFSGKGYGTKLFTLRRAVSTLIANGVLDMKVRFADGKSATYYGNADAPVANGSDAKPVEKKDGCDPDAIFIVQTVIRG